jgi:hypothetical protein
MRRLEARKGAYVRTDEFSDRFEPQLATYKEIQHLANRRELAVARRRALFERAERRYATLVEQDYEKNPSTRGSHGTLLQIAVTPSFPVSPLSDENALENLLRSERITWRSVGFPRIQELVTQHESVLDLHSSYGFSLLEVTTWGQAYFASEVERVDGDEHFIHLYSFLGHVLVYLTYAARLYGRLAFDGLVHVRVKLTGLRGIRFRFERMPDYRTIASRFDDDLDVGIDVPSDALLRSPSETAKKLYRLIFFAVNWPAGVADDSALDGLIAKAIEYNHFG